MEAKTTKQYFFYVLKGDETLNPEVNIQRYSYFKNGVKIKLHSDKQKQNIYCQKTNLYYKKCWAWHRVAHAYNPSTLGGRGAWIA